MALTISAGVLYWRTCVAPTGPRSYVGLRGGAFLQRISQLQDGNLAVSVGVSPASQRRREKRRGRGLLGCRAAEPEHDGLCVILFDDLDRQCGPCIIRAGDSIVYDDGLDLAGEAHERFVGRRHARSPYLAGDIYERKLRAAMPGKRRRHVIEAGRRLG